MSKRPTKGTRNRVEVGARFFPHPASRKREEMRNLTIPPAPITEPRAQMTPVAPKFTLDLGFVARVYRSMLWFGVVCTALAVPVLRTAPAIGSFVGGLVLAALLLRGQEIGVRALLQPKEKMMGLDARLAMVLLLPLKFVAVAGILVVFNALGVLRPGPLALGFFAAQLVLVAKFVGWMLQRSRVSQTR